MTLCGGYFNYFVINAFFLLIVSLMRIQRRNSYHPRRHDGPRINSTHLQAISSEEYAYADTEVQSLIEVNLYLNSGILAEDVCYASCNVSTKNRLTWSSKSYLIS